MGFTYIECAARQQNSTYEAVLVVADMGSSSVKVVVDLGHQGAAVCRSNGRTGRRAVTVRNEESVLASTRHRYKELYDTHRSIYGCRTMRTL
jgi:hypothetical protein